MKEVKLYRVSCRLKVRIQTSNCSVFSMFLHCLLKHRPMKKELACIYFVGLACIYPLYLGDPAPQLWEKLGCRQIYLLTHLSNFSISSVTRPSEHVLYTLLKSLLNLTSVKHQCTVTRVNKETLSWIKNLRYEISWPQYESNCECLIVKEDLNKKGHEADLPSFLCFKHLSTVVSSQAQLTISL